MSRTQFRHALLATLLSGTLGSSWLSAQEWINDGPPPVFERLPPTEDEFPTSEDYDALPEALPDPLSARKRSLPAGGGPFGMGSGSPFGMKAYWIPSQNVSSQPGDLSMSGVQANASLPISIDPEGGGVWLATANFERLEISTSAVLPDSQLPVPDELWKINVGAMHFRELDNGWKAGGMLMVGTASDQPFAGLRDMTATALGFLNVPTGERDAWNFSLFYSPTSQIPFPIPGVAYAWKPNDQFTANIGVPFSMQYQPTESFTLSASYMPLTNVNVLAKQSLGEGWSLYGGYQVLNETFWLADREDSQERFYLFDQRLKLGLQRELGLGFSLDVSAAYVFDRTFFQADSFSGDRSDRIDIDPGVAGTIQLIWSR